MKTLIFCLGEVLIDEIGGNRHIGGAPMNTAIHLKRLGTESFFISSIGSDNDGQKIREFLFKEGLQEGLSEHPLAPTGLARAVTTDTGEHFEIVTPAAWNEIQLNKGTEDKIRNLRDGDSVFLYFGSLAMHFEGNRRLYDRLIRELGEKTSVPITVFLDINIRRPFIDRNLALWCLSRSNWLKLNDQELAFFLEWKLCDAGTEEEMLQSLYRRYRLQGTILTKGATGSAFFSPQCGYLRLKASPVSQIVDTIGAGDAYCAVFLAGLGSTPSPNFPELLRKASEKAAEVCGKSGAV
jgi:fructokinase